MENKNILIKTYNEFEGSEILQKYGIDMAKSYVCKEKNELTSVIEEVNFPVVMKILSPDILHKTDAGCVKLNLKTIDECYHAYDQILKNAHQYNSSAKIDGILIQEMVKPGLEIILGMKRDSQFGPVMMFGLGGIYVEIFEDVSLRLIPITEHDAIEMIQETQTYKILKGARGKEYDIDFIMKALLGLSKFVEENPSIQEIDINPLFLYDKEEGGKGVDCVIRYK